ncbi:AAA family ATPase [Hydrogenimonas thermophila]|uniref:PD-(D/E)XK nuclease superfamily protein n=1 Tax=Hydrogenimonas thermophila TaxID=223786 RepID=A0A1I5Q9A4_9BACT|nr:AAA family ATPase [Hydrogenimonas thermophila]SFP42853.1 PD-(D/E)XK nuclease superfamily protein [Hydrogenimonas thermophila]
MKKIIYGESNFRKVKIDSNYLYIDKTSYIEKLESLNENFLIFLRPRRFGKSLFLSTLQYYYDENAKSEFDELFGDTYIGKHPTPLKNSFRILFFEFSGINTDESMQSIYEQFTFKIKMSLSSYFKSYNYPQSYEDLKEINNPTSLMEYFFEIVKDDRIYILIDEYDHFANAILSYSMDDFLKIVGKGGFVRSFYEVLKTATFTGTVQKIFITGVTPITLDSLSSGFNIISNISYHKSFNAMAGFTQDEVEYALNETIFKRCQSIKKDELLEEIKAWYNGYLFQIKVKDRIYNATLINYFISRFDYSDCEKPKKMLDSNVASDYKALMRLFNIGDKERNFDILKEIIEKGYITGTIKDRYDLNKTFSEDDFITLIYSMGFITLKDETFGDVYDFEIPNYVIKQLYFNYFAIEIDRRNNLKIDANINHILRDLAMGKIDPFKEQLNEVIKTLSNRDHMGFDEKYFHIITLSLLSFASFYFIDSQPEIERRYPDILLIGRDEKVPNNYLFELKWVKSRDNYESIKQDGIEQVKGYLEIEKVKAIPKLRSFLLIGSKDGVEFIEISF